MESFWWKKTGGKKGGGDKRKEKNMEFHQVFLLILPSRLIKRRNTPRFLQLQYFLTCSCVLIPYLILLTETSESEKKKIFFKLSGAYSKN